uniref:Uncharacterized protein n=1 Tax=Arundo donax TaxID=35708 RepID=A0A0A9BAL1_ARUDO
MGSLVLSVGSKTVMEIEDDANSKFMDQTRSNEHVGDGYKTPDRECSLPYCALRACLTTRLVVLVLLVLVAATEPVTSYVRIVT